MTISRFNVVKIEETLTIEKFFPATPHTSAPMFGSVAPVAIPRNPFRAPTLYKCSALADECASQTLAFYSACLVLGD